MRRQSGAVRIPGAVPIGILAAGMVLTLTLTGYVRLYETSSENTALTEQLESLSAEQETLQSRYDELTDEEALTSAARRLGLQEPEAWQQRTVTLPVSDHGERLAATGRSAPARLWENLQAALTDFLEYFR